MKSVADLGIDYDDGSFHCYDNHLTSLKGAPSHVDRSFFCHINKLTSLEGAPRHVGAHFDCGRNQLTSLEGAPRHVGDDFYCYHNQLTSLQGAPRHVGGSFYCPNNKLTSLKGVHKQIAEIQGRFACTQNPIESHVLGLLLIKGITEIHLDHKQVREILNRHLGKGRAGMLQAQEELIEAGLEEFARL